MTKPNRKEIIKWEFGRFATWYRILFIIMTIIFIIINIFISKFTKLELKILRKNEEIFILISNIVEEMRNEKSERK